MLGKSTETASKKIGKTFEPQKCMWEVGVDHLLNLRVVWGGGYAHELFKFVRLDAAAMS